MIRSPYETLDLGLPTAPCRDNAANELTSHLVRIVRRAIRRPDDRSPLACAVRQAVAQVETEPDLRNSYDNEFRIRQVARRVSALLAPDDRDPPGREAQRETVCV